MKTNNPFISGNVSPMSPTLIKLPFDSPDFIFEIKWDGFRGMTYVKNGVTEIYSRRGYLFNKKFPSIVKCFEKMKKNMILDGEIVVLDKKGRADFEALRYYKPGTMTLYYYIFDLLFYDNQNLLNEPLIKRKKLLKKIIPESNSLRYVDFIEEKGIRFFKLAEKEKLEGIIAKKKDSIYLPGIRTREWLKIKTHAHKTLIEKYPREF